MSSSSSPRVSPVSEKVNALQSFDQAMAAIPLEQKKEYLQALQKCPDLVATETDPLMFLRYTDFNTWAAAERMCTQWRERCNLFQERAFLPMTIDGKGAMDYQDILVLQAGFPAMLPKTKCGRQVLLIDRGKWLPGTERINRLRAGLYIGTLLAKDPRAQEPKGVLVITYLIQPRLEKFDHVFAKRIAQLLQTAFCVKIEPHHCCVLPRTITERLYVSKEQQRDVPAEEKRQTKLSFCTDTISCFYGPQFSSLNINMHFQINPGDIQRVLLNAGCTMEGIPTCYGGLWSPDQAQDWCRQQAALESKSCWNRHAHKPESSLVRESTNGPANQHAAKSNAGNANTKESDNNLQSKWTKDRKRAVNAMHSRRKRQKRKQELEAMKDECEKLKFANQALKQEHDRLQSVLATVQQKVASLEERFPVGGDDDGLEPLALSMDESPPQSWSGTSDVPSGNDPFGEMLQQQQGLW